MVVNASKFPTWEIGDRGAFLGRNGFYTGVAGEPAFYQTRNNVTRDYCFAPTTVTLKNIQVKSGGTPKRLTGTSGSTGPRRAAISKSFPTAPETQWATPALADSA